MRLGFKEKELWGTFKFRRNFLFGLMCFEWKKVYEDLIKLEISLRKFEFKSFNYKKSDWRLKCNNLKNYGTEFAKIIIGIKITH